MGSYGVAVGPLANRLLDFLVLLLIFGVVQAPIPRLRRFCARIYAVTNLFNFGYTYAASFYGS